jgi:hypothetical protein
MRPRLYLIEHKTEIETGHATAGHDSIENGEPSSLPPSQEKVKSRWTADHRRSPRPHNWSFSNALRHLGVHRHCRPSSSAATTRVPRGWPHAGTSRPSDLGSGFRFNSSLPLQCCEPAPTADDATTRRNRCQLPVAAFAGVRTPASAASPSSFIVASWVTGAGELDLR